MEFSKEEDAKQCMENFVSMGCKLPTNIKAETLASCQGFQPDVPEPAPKSDADLDLDPEAKHKEKEVIEDNDQKEDEENHKYKEDIVEPPAKRKKITDAEQGDDKTPSDKENIEKSKEVSYFYKFLTELVLCCQTLRGGERHSEPRPLIAELAPLNLFSAVSL